MEYDKNKYKELHSKFMCFMWYINPVAFINELILGQRVAVNILEDISIKDTPRIERCYTPCPHCNTYHDSRIWSGKNSFMNWFGLYCPNCGKIIPCMLSVVSFIFLAITYPVWGWFKNQLKTSWLQKQPDRYRNIDFFIPDNSSKRKTGIQLGLIFGLGIFAVNLISKISEKGYVCKPDVRSILFSSVLSAIFFGWFMSWYLYRKNKNKN